MGGLYGQLSQTKSKLVVTYQNQWNADTYETQFLKNLETDLLNDQQRGFTGHGPHREDLQLLLNDHLAQETASRGEIRTAVLALKLIELKLIESMRNIRPIILLDDVFSELDGKRRHALTDKLESHQTFITTTDADLVLQHLATNHNIIPLS